MILCVVVAAIVTHAMAFAGGTLKMQENKFETPQFGQFGMKGSQFGGKGPFGPSKSSPFPFPANFKPKVYDPSQKPSNRPGNEQRVNIPGIGLIEVQVLMPRSRSIQGPLAIAQHGANPDWSAITEFDAVAAELAEEGYRVLLPNLHSNPNTKPAVFGKSISDADFEQVLVQLINLEGDGSEKAELPLLLGKSWGGGAAAIFAANNPNMVEKLVLVAPPPNRGGNAENVQKLSMPLQVFWAKDDPIVPVSGVAVFEEFSPQADIHVVDTGGHKVLPEYTDPIVAFAALL